MMKNYFLGFWVLWIAGVLVAGPVGEYSLRRYNLTTGETLFEKIVPCKPMGYEDAFLYNRDILLWLSMQSKDAKLGEWLSEHGARIDRISQSVRIHYSSSIARKLMFILALRYKDLEVVSILLDCEIASYHEPLHYAVIACDVETTRGLLATGGCSINQKNQFGQTPLLAALMCWGATCDSGYDDMINFLLEECHADPNCVYEHTKQSALMYAVKNHNAEIVHLLLKHGAYVNVVDENGLTALHHAIENWHEQDDDDIIIITALVRAGANLYKPDNSKRFPACMAIASRDIKLCRLLGVSLEHHRATWECIMQ